MTNPRIANLASAWTLSFGAMHVAWAISYYWFPACGRVTLGQDFQSQVLLVLIGVIDVALTRWVVYDVWFIGCGLLLGAVARRVARP